MIKYTMITYRTARWKYTSEKKERFLMQKWIVKIIESKVFHRLLYPLQKKKRNGFKGVRRAKSESRSLADCIMHSTRLSFVLLYITLYLFAVELYRRQCDFFFLDRPSYRWVLYARPDRYGICIQLRNNYRQRDATRGPRTSSFVSFSRDRYRIPTAPRRWIYAVNFFFPQMTEYFAIGSNDVATDSLGRNVNDIQTKFNATIGDARIFANRNSGIYKVLNISTDRRIIFLLSVIRDVRGRDRIYMHIMYICLCIFIICTPVTLQIEFNSELFFFFMTT